MTKRIVAFGILSGLIMGIGLFVGGAVCSRIIYGPQFAPPGKFEPSRIKAFYFIWTKLLIGAFFGLLAAFFLEASSLSKRMRSPLQGAGLGFFIWFAFSLWDISHPLVYGPGIGRDRLFWLLYSLTGFLALGCSLGWFYKRETKRDALKNATPSGAF